MGQGMNRHIMHACIIIVLVAVTFCRSPGNDFVWDDIPVVVENQLFNGSAGIMDVLTAEDTIKEGVGRSTGYYRPLTYLSFYIDRSLWGMNPAGFHFTGLLLHSAVALSLYALLCSLLPMCTHLPLLAALFFALNPVTVEAVCFVSARNVMLCALSIILALLAHRKGSHILAAFCILAAAASKEMGLLSPLILVLHDRIIGKRFSSWKIYSWYAAPVVLFLTAQKFIVTHETTPPPEILLKIFVQALSRAAELVSRYIAVIFVPGLQKVGYGLKTGIYWQPLYFSGVLLIVLAMIMMWRKKLLTGLFGWFWFMLFLAPVLIPGAYYTLPMADRHAYLPALGIAMCVAESLGSWPATRQLALMVPIIVIYALFSFTGTSSWRNNGTLFKQMIKDAPLAQTGYTGLAYYYFKGGDFSAAERLLQEGLNAGALPEKTAENIRLSMLCTEGESLLRDGKNVEAEKLFHKALQINPDFVPALIDLGGVAMQRGDIEVAFRYFSRAAEIHPDNYVSHFNLAEIYRLRGDMKAAEKELLEYRRLGGEK